MSPWLALFGVIYAVLLVHISAMAAVAGWVGLQPETADFGFGPVVLRRNVGGVEVRLHAVPLGGSVTTANDSAHPVRHTMPSVVATSLVTALGLGGLGLTDGLAFATAAASAIFRGAISPTGTAQTIIGAAIATIQAGPVQTIAARAAVAIGVFNFVLVTWVPLLRGNAKLMLLGTLVPMLVSVPWLLAWAVYLL